MFTKAMIIPTGDELAAGIVLDTDAPEIMKNLLAINGSAEVVRIAVTGRANTPDLWTIVHIMGEEQMKERISRFL